MGIKLKTCTKELPCKLTDAEVQMAGAELAAAVEAVNTEKERQKQIKADMKAWLMELSGDVDKLAHKVSRREEMREVEVEIVLVPDSMLVQEVRIDTGEVILTRRAGNDEMENSLDG